MVDPGISQPADRSGSASPAHTNQVIATTSSDNDGSSNPSVSHTEKSPLSLPSAIDQGPTPAKYNAAEQPGLFQALPQLQVRTGLGSDDAITSTTELDPFIHYSRSSASLPQRTPSLRILDPDANASPTSSSRDSFLTSPQLIGMSDITPLPSPIGGRSSWKLSRVDSQSLSRASSTASRPSSELGLRASESNQMLGPTRSRSRSKQYAALDKLGEGSLEAPSKLRHEMSPQHARNRSLSDYVPPARSVLVKPRSVVVSESGSLEGMEGSSSTDSESNGLHREQYLGAHRGITSTAARPPTPPRSSRGGDGDSILESVIDRSTSEGPRSEVYSVRSVQTQQPRKYRKIRELGQGTFSQVNLAVRVETDAGNDMGSIPNPGAVAGTSQKLVAVKIVEYGPAGGADEERLEVSLKREVEILKSLNHPSLVQLKAFGSDNKRALLVLDYCPGGDLFEVASSMRRPMCPELIRRIFAELVAAVRYLHEQFIVHRDIKLESGCAVLSLC